MPYVYDAGALVAADRADQRLWTWHRRILQRYEEPLIPAGVLAQTWRDGAQQANLARLLKASQVVGLDAKLAREVGELCGETGTRDTTDAAVAIIAARYAAVLLTSDPGDLTKLLDCLGRAGQDVEIVIV